MTRNRRQSADVDNVFLEKEKVPGREAEKDTRKNCRCKEVAKKTPREMLNLMIGDLTFWKKKSRGQK